jgi:hypothetical protein
MVRMGWKLCPEAHSRSRTSRRVSSTEYLIARECLEPVPSLSSLGRSGMTDLFAMADPMAAAVQAVQEAEREARHAGQIERAITFQFVLRSGSDALLALAELLKSEATRTSRPRVPKGGRRLRWPRSRKVARLETHNSQQV